MMMTADAKEFLTFTLGDENYALDILTVKEIRGYESVTKIANAPPFIKGVINLRGDIVPIVDLRIKFNVGEATYNEFTIVIVLHIHNRIVGIVVDGVSDVVSLEAEQLLPGSLQGGRVAAALLSARAGEVVAREVVDRLALGTRWG